MSGCALRGGANFFHWLSRNGSGTMSYWRILSVQVINTHQCCITFCRCSTRDVYVSAMAISVTVISDDPLI